MIPSAFGDPVAAPAVPVAGPPAAVALPIIRLARFRRLMLAQGVAVDLPRQCEDPDYLHRCLAEAWRRAAPPDLQRVARDLFAIGAPTPAPAAARLH